ncbi:MAG: protein kinase [Planctomycetota bacterium]|nr:protein kinase [Planctomycetota bacterium]
MDQVHKRYQILGTLGQGGMGCVYEVTDAHSGEILALKRLLNASPSLLESEFERLRTLGNHPGISQVYEFSLDENGLPYFTMELVRGETIVAYCDRQKNPLETARIFAQVARVLEFLHANKIVHGDLKPGNLIVTHPEKHQGSEIKIIDLGLARTVESAISEEDTYSFSKERVQSFSGSVHFLAPECIHSQTPTTRSDLYSLGVILYRCLEGELPFVGEHFSDILAKHLNQKVPPFRKNKKSIPLWLRNLTFDLLSKRPSNRPAGAQDVRDRIENELGTCCDPFEDATTRIHHQILSAPIIGRSQELKNLHSTQQSILKNQPDSPRLLLVSGLPRTGKTRLLEEFRHLQQRQGILCHSISFAESSSLTSRKFQSFLRQLVGLLEERRPDIGDQFLSLLQEITRSTVANPGTDGAFPHIKEERVRSLHSVLAFFKEFLVAARDFTPPIPLLSIHLDTLDTAPSFLFEVLHFFLRNAGSSRILLTANFSTDTDGLPCPGPNQQAISQLSKDIQDHERGSILPIAPLPDTSRNMLIESILGSGSGISELSRKLGQERGDLVDLHEMLITLAREGQLRYQNARWTWESPTQHLPIPLRTGQLVDSYLEFLSDFHTQVLEVAAAMNATREVTAQRISQVLTQRSLEEIEEALNRFIWAYPLLQRTEIGLENISGYRFDSAAIRTHLIRQIPSSTSQEIHQRIAEILTQDEADLSEVAYYYLHSGPSLRGIETLIQAASRRKLFHQEARTHLHTALRQSEQLNRPDLVASCLHQLGTLDLQYGNSESAHQHFQASLDLEKEPRRRAQSLLLLARMSSYTDDHARTLKYLEKARNQIRNTDSFDLVAQIDRNRARSLAFLQKWEEALSVLDQAEENLLKARFERPDQHPLEMGDMLHVRGRIHHNRGELDRANHFYRKSLELQISHNLLTGVATVYHDLGRICWARGEIEEAFAFLKQGLSYSRRTADIFHRADIYHSIARVHQSTGDLRLTRRFLRRALETHRLTGNRIGFLRVCVCIGDLYQRLGQIPRANRYYERARRHSLKISLPYLPTLDRALGLRAESLGNMDEARTHFLSYRSQAERSKNSQELAEALWLLARLSSAQQDQKQTLSFLTRARRSLPQEPSRIHLQLFSWAVEWIQEREDWPSSVRETRSRIYLKRLENVSDEDSCPYTWYARGLISMSSSDWNQAKQDFQKSAAIWREEQEVFNESRSNLQLARTFANLGSEWDDRTEDLYTTCLTRFTNLEASLWVARTCHHYGIFLAEVDEMKEASQQHTRAANLYQKLGDLERSMRSRSLEKQTRPS